MSRRPTKRGARRLRRAERAAPPLLTRGLDPWLELPVCAAIVFGTWFCAFDVDVAGGRLDTALGLALLLGGGFLAFGFRGAGRLRSLLALFAATWVGLSLLSLVTTTDLGYSLVGAARMAAALACFVLPLLARAEEPEAVAYRLALAIVVAGAITSASGISQWLRNVVVLSAPSWRTFGTFNSPNALAGYLVLAGPLALAVGLCQTERLWRVLGWFMVALMGAAVVLTQSRAGLLAFLIGVAVFGALALPGTPMRRARIAGAGFAGLAALVLAVPMVRERMLASFGAQNHSIMFRVHCWKAALASALERPLLGWGSGCYRIGHLANAEVGYTMNAHHDALNTAAECGVLAAAAALAAVAAAIVCALRTQAGPAESPVRLRLCQGAAAGLVGLLLHGLIDCNWVQRPTLCALMAVFAIVTLLRADGAPAASLGRGAHRCAYGAVLLSGLFVALAAGLSSTALATCDHAAQAGSEGRLSLAASLYRRADRLFPPDGSALRKAMLFENPGPEALEAGYATLLRRNPWRTEHYRSMGDTLLVMGEYEEALATYDEMVRRAPVAVPGLVGKAACNQALGNTDAVEADMRRLLEMERGPYGTYQAVPERATLEFVYGWAALAELHPDGAEMGEAVTRLRKYVDRWDRRLEKLSKEYRGQREMVNATLSGEGLSLAKTNQARIMLARLLWLQAEAAEDEDSRDALREEARALDAVVVTQLDAGEWRGVLVETATYRAEGGL